MSQDPPYYATRAKEERQLALAATDPAARRIHLDLAFEYARRASGNAPMVPDAVARNNQPTA